MTTANYMQPGVVLTYYLGNQDPGAGSDIDTPIVIPTGYEGTLESISMACTETFAGAANTAFHIGATAGATTNVALAIDAAGGDAFTAADTWAVAFTDGATPVGNVTANFGAPGNAVTSVSSLKMAAGTHYASFQGGTGTLTAGQAETVITIRLRKAGSST